MERYKAELQLKQDIEKEKLTGCTLTRYRRKGLFRLKIQGGPGADVTHRIGLTFSTAMSCTQELKNLHTK